MMSYSENVEALANPCTAESRKTVDQLYAMIGWGKYHSLLYVVCALGWAADSIETGLLSFLKQEVVKTWDVGPVSLSLLQNVVFVGELLGSLLWGPLADRVGRRPAFFLANLGLVSLGLASALVPRFEWLVLLRFCVGGCIGGMVVPFDTLLECSPSSIMDQVTFGVQLFWTFGTVYVNVAAALLLPMDFRGIASWRVLTVVSAAPILVCVLGVCVIEESPLWLQERGRDDEAMAVLKRMARYAHVDISAHQLQPFTHDVSPAFSDLWRWPYLRRTVALAAMFLFAIMAFYGASLADPYIFGTAAGTDYGLILFSACGEMAGVGAMSLATRRVSVLNGLAVSFVIGGLAMYTVLLKDQMPKLALAVVVFIARAACMASSCGFSLVAPKAYPTYIRCTAHACANLFGRAGGLLATLAIDVGFYLQLTLFGTANALAAIVTVTASRQLQAEEQAFDVLRDDMSGTSSFLSASAVERVPPSRRRHTRSHS